MINVVSASAQKATCRDGIVRDPRCRSLPVTEELAQNSFFGHVGTKNGEDPNMTSRKSQKQNTFQEIKAFSKSEQQVSDVFGVSGNVNQSSL